jgi:hypothetical protein
MDRPAVADLQFESKTGRTPEGWPVEQVKAGGLPGLCAYAGFYATRKLRPGLVKDSKALGLDPSFTAIFWTFWPGFATAEELCRTFIHRAGDALIEGDDFTALSVCDALAEGVDPHFSFMSYLRPTQQAQLVAAVRSILLLAEPRLASHPCPHPALSSAVENLRVRLAECTAHLEIIGTCSSGAVFTHGAPVVSAPPFSPVQSPASVASSSTLWSSASPSEIATQWTHIEAALFRAIPMQEWIGAGWDKPRYEHAADCTVSGGELNGFF